jgi:chemotaxis protein MotB
VAKQGAKIIIIKKRKKHHAAHHGGSWKVAYADFVTAMMAFFMVMWILGMSEDVKKDIQGYFSNPVGFKKGYSAGKSPLSVGNSPGRVEQMSLKLVSRMQQQEQFDKAGANIKAKLKEGGLASIASKIDVITTKTGLRIELSEDQKGDVFFPVSSSEMTPVMRQTLVYVAQELRPLGNGIIIEGHTDATPYVGHYSNWELSADRANAARRVLEENGVAASRVREVRGLADRDPRIDADVLDPRNRRITIFLPFNESPTDGRAAEMEPASQTAPAASASSAPAAARPAGT